MAAPCFIAFAADPSAATGPPSAVATSATSGTVKTILQIKPNTSKIRIIEWGYTIDVPPASPLRVEAVVVNVAATVTTLGSGVMKYNDASGAGSTVSVGTSTSGFNASAEGTITVSRLVGYQYENGIYFKQQLPLGREAEINTSEYFRIRATPTSSAAINIMPYVIWEE